MNQAYQQQELQNFRGSSFTCIKQEVGPFSQAEEQSKSCFGTHHSNQQQVSCSIHHQQQQSQQIHQPTMLHPDISATINSIQAGILGPSGAHHQDQNLCAQSKMQIDFKNIQASQINQENYSENLFTCVNGPNEQNEQMTNQIQSSDNNQQDQTANQSNFPDNQDDRLMIRFDGGIHLVDSIIKFKRTKQGVAFFKLAMCCLCCKSKAFWFSKTMILQNACAQLRYQASQGEEFHLDGIDIQSQKTNEQLDDEDEEDEDMSIKNIHSWVNESNLKNLSLELVDCKKEHEQEHELRSRYNQQNSQTKMHCLSNTQQVRINKTTNSVKFADDLQIQKKELNSRRGRCSIAKINLNKSQSVFDSKTVRKSTDARRRRPQATDDDDLQFQHCETENPKQLCTKLSQNHSLVSNKSLVSGYGCAGTAGFYYNYDDYTNGAMNELVTPLYFNFSEDEYGGEQQPADLTLGGDKQTHIKNTFSITNHKVDADNDIGMEDDISMVCEVQPDNFDQSCSNLNKNNMEITRVTTTTTSQGAVHNQSGHQTGSVLTIPPLRNKNIEDLYKNHKKFDSIPFPKRNNDGFQSSQILQDPIFRFQKLHSGSKLYTLQRLKPFGADTTPQSQQKLTKKRKRVGQQQVTVSAYQQSQHQAVTGGDITSADMGNNEMSDFGTVFSDVSESHLGQHHLNHPLQASQRQQQQFRCCTTNNNEVSAAHQQQQQSGFKRTFKKIKTQQVKQSIERPTQPILSKLLLSIECGQPGGLLFSQNQ